MTQSGRQVHWPEERGYAQETKQEVQSFLHAHPFVSQGPTKWKVMTPHGYYIVTENSTRYIVIYHSPGLVAEEVLTVSHSMHRNDAWCRVAIAVMRHAGRIDERLRTRGGYHDQHGRQR